MLGPSANSPPCGSRCRRRGCRTRCRPLLSAVLRRPSSSVLLLMLLLVMLFSTLPLVFLVMFLSSVSSESDTFCRLKNSPSSRVRFRSDFLWTGPSPSAITYASHVTFLVWFAVLSHAVSILSPATLARPVHRPASGLVHTLAPSGPVSCCLVRGSPRPHLSPRSATELLVQLFACQVSTKYVLPRVTISTFTSQSDLSELPWRSLFNRPSFISKPATISTWGAVSEKHPESATMS